MKNIQTKLLLFAVFIIVISFLPNILDFTTSTKSQKDISNEKEEQKTFVEKEPDYTKGELIFDGLKNKVCEELDLCWVAGGYAINGDKILKKEFPTYWGSDKTLILPEDEWIKLSDIQKKDLYNYLNYIRVNKITVGRVVPAEFSDGTIDTSRNRIMLDKTVWTSN